MRNVFFLSLYLVSSAAFCGALRDELQAEQGIKESKVNLLNASPAIGKVKALPLACDGQPVTDKVVTSKDETARKIWAAVNRPGVYAYQGTEMESLKDALFNVAQQTANERYKMLHPDGSVRKTCSVDFTNN
jgi:hypothetical protein